MSNKKQTYRWILLLAAALVFFFLVADILLPRWRAQRHPVTGVNFVMDTVLEYKFYGASGEAAASAVVRQLQELESKVSMYRNDSEIAALNRQAGKGYVRLSPEVFQLVQLCAEYGRQSEGVFDVTIAPVTRLWDVTAVNPRIPDAAEIENLLLLVNYQDILLDAANSSAMLRKEGQQIDVGGIAKGYACDLARQTAVEHGVRKGYISIGGNLMVIGKKDWSHAFLYGVRDPRGGGNDYIAVLPLYNSTMATSGDYERFFIKDGVRYHHIMDPATGWPAETELMSVSVVTPDGAYADFMSTCLFIKGKDFVLSHLNAYDCGLVVIDKDNNVYVSDRLKSTFEMADPTGRYTYQKEVS